MGGGQQVLLRNVTALGSERWVHHVCCFQKAADDAMEGLLRREGIEPVAYVHRGVWTLPTVLTIVPLVRVALYKGLRRLHGNMGFQEG